MSNITFNPYFFFKGNAREAMEFYKNIFGGELTFQTYGDVGAATDDNPAEYIMHAQLKADDVVIMASDSFKASEKAAKVTMSLSGNEEEKLRGYFDSLSEGIEVEYPLKKEFWGDIFGALCDKYGIEWMVSISPKQD
jgi:PhnB protein